MAAPTLTGLSQKKEMAKEAERNTSERGEILEKYGVMKIKRKITVHGGSR